MCRAMTIGQQYRPHLAAKDRAARAKAQANGVTTNKIRR
jgi:hypothetical protein